MAAKDIPCNFKKDNVLCDGEPHIGRVTNYQTNIVSYFIGCKKYKYGDKWHRYIKIKQDEVDISLLQSLFTGSASVSIVYFTLLFFSVKLNIVSNCK